MDTRAIAVSVAASRRRQWLWIAAAAVCLIVSAAAPARAQYNSGSSGVHGAFPPLAVPSNATYMLWNLRTGLIRYCTGYDEILRPDTCTGEISSAQILNIPQGGLVSQTYEFTSFNVVGSPSVAVLQIVPVGYDGPTPLTILSQGTVRLNRAVLNLNGGRGTGTQSGLPPTGFGAAGGRPGPGGFAGGNGGKMGAPSTAGNPGFGPAGGAGSGANAFQAGAAAGPTPVATSLIPLIGGSGGGGGGGIDTNCGFRGGGGGGGGGGGAVLIAANTNIVLEGGGGIAAEGAVGGDGCHVSDGGRGSGGSVRLAASSISGNGSISVDTGIVRIEGNSSGYSGAIDTIRGTVLAAPQPATPTTIPTLRITSVGGIAVGQTPTGSASTPDVTFASAPAGPVTIDLAASNVPLGTNVNVRAVPVIGAPSTAATALTGNSPESSTATASLTIPAGAGVITAVTTFPVTSAMLDRLPRIPGLTPALIEVTAEANGVSRTFVIGKDSRRVELRLGSDGSFVAVF